MQGEDSFPGVQRRASAAKVCTSEARKIKVPLARARSRAPQEGLVSLLGAERRRCLLGSALRAGTGSQRWGTEDAKRPEEGGDFLPSKHHQLLLATVIESGEFILGETESTLRGL